MEQEIAYTLIGVLSAAVFILSYALVQSRKNKKASEAQSRAMDEKLLQAQLQAAHYAKLMDGFAQRILDKNNIIIELEKKIKPPDEGLNAPGGPAEKKREKLLAMKLLSEEDWAQFKSIFYEVHPGYLQNIKKDFPGLTRAELLLVLLMKLKLGTRDIASKLGISPTSVHKTRYRLKKKLNLTDEDDDLEKYVYHYEKIMYMYEHALSGYLTTNKEGYITEINNTELNWLGYRREEAVGKLTGRNIYSEDSIKTFEYYFPLCRQGKVKSLIGNDMILKRKDGTSFPIIASCIAIFNADGSFKETRACHFKKS